MEVLGGQLSCLSTVFIVLDGLDEWRPTPDTAYNLIQQLEDLPHTKLLITSRHSIPFSSRKVFVDLPIHATSEDLKSYIGHHIQSRLLRRIQLSDDVKGEVISKIEGKARGMYVVTNVSSSLSM